MEKTRVIKPKNTDDQAQKAVIAIKEVHRPKRVELFEKITEDGYYHRNFYYPGGKTAFPDAPKMQYVERYYPHATKGPMAFDTLSYTDDEQVFELKRKHLAKAGIKYAIVKSESTEMEIMEQMA